jgi:hypothetical protein
MIPAAAQVRIEARHLARSPLLWLGVALAAASMAPPLWSSWPVLAGDDLFAYQSSLLVGTGAAWAGAWLGLRDRTSGAADLLAVTPTAPWRLWSARLAALAAAGAAGFALLFAASLAVSAVRGGRGTADLRLLVDGALAVVLGGLVGVAVGRLSGSRLVAVLAGVLWYLLCMFAADSGMWPAYRLAPALMQEGSRSVEFGFLPDPFWPHLAYLLGLVLLAGLLLLGLVARGSGQRPAHAPVLAAVVAGLVLVASGGARLVALPEAVVPLGPDRADWKPGAEAEAVLSDPSFAYPEDGRATSCAGDTALTACVYPAYGIGLARRVHAAMRPVAGLLGGLSGVPTRVRMVPLNAGSCRGGELQLWEQSVRGLERREYAGAYLTCALGQDDEPEATGGAMVDARDAVRFWGLLASGTLTRQELQRASEQNLWQLQASGERPSAAVAPALAMAELPPGQVRAELAPLWDRLRAGTLPLSELPGQRL